VEQAIANKNVREIFLLGVQADADLLYRYLRVIAAYPTQARSKF
jgi:hypothetical protein